MKVLKLTFTTFILMIIVACWKDDNRSFRKVLKLLR
ncbi:MAG: hypothetical protein ACJAUH_001586 [Saprospiraceae bacterium]|jgi:hypothetical protein